MEAVSTSLPFRRSYAREGPGTDVRICLALHRMVELVKLELRLGGAVLEQIIQSLLVAPTFTKLSPTAKDVRADEILLEVCDGARPGFPRWR